jgi:hypothetical protein
LRRRAGRCQRVGGGWEDTARHRGVERRVPAEDPAFQLLQLGSRLDADLLDQRGPGAPAHLQRLGLPAGPVEGEHEQRVELLT